MNARKLKKTCFFFKNLQLLKFEKIMASELFEFVEQFMMDTLMLKLAQVEKTGSIGKIFISQENLIINYHFQN